MSYANLLQNLSFARDPFLRTNADEEEYLENYFIEPPFFKAVHGDITSPKSAVVYAPRGGGKTALKRRLELSARTENFLSVTYNSFPTSGLKLEDIDTAFHLKGITRLLLVAVLSKAAATGVKDLRDEQRHLLYLIAKEHLTKLGKAEIAAAMSSVANLSDKARDVWMSFSGTISAGLSIVAGLCGVKLPELPKPQRESSSVGTLLEQIKFLTGIAFELGFASTYILVDKVDENQLTSTKATATLNFIRPLLSDLEILELPKTAFKLFLWDLIEADARAFSRPDRVKTYSLRWTEAQLKTMLSRRLSAHSDGKVQSLASICPLEGGADIDGIIVALSDGSPRNIIRICKSILDNQSELDSGSGVLSEMALLKGVEDACAEMAGEMVQEKALRELRKLKKADFTLTNVYADVFRISQGAGTQKVQAWQDAGIVNKIGQRQEKRGNRPSNVYAVKSPIVLKHMFADVNVLEFAGRKMRHCVCGHLLLRDWDRSATQTCENCENQLNVDSLLKP